ncbi:MAG TPA: aldo/keto reductase [Pararhizobium sp.]|nr:aldo/keto reductase [Pararhizobium sp.]
MLKGNQIIPQIGLGTFGRTGDAGVDGILAGLEIGYRHLDTAQSYDTESTVGLALERSGLPRPDVFVTTKVAVANLDRARFMPSVRESLDRLRMPQVDLLLIHWPSPHDEFPFEGYIEALAEAKSLGLARHIGVSNFPIALIERAAALIGAGEIVNDQVEIHPFFQNRRLCDYCAGAGIAVTAYMPLAKGRVTEERVLREIAEKHGATPAQISLAWLLKLGVAVIPASQSRRHMQANFEAGRLDLAEDDMERIAALDTGERMIDRDGGPDWD